VIGSFLAGLWFSGRLCRIIWQHRNVLLALCSIGIACYLTFSYAEKGNAISVIYLNPTIASFLEFVQMDLALFWILINSVPVLSIAMTVYGLLVWILPLIRQFFVGMNRIEKGYLIAVLAAAAVLIPVVYGTTNLFFCPQNRDGKIVIYDALYTTDTGEIFDSDCFFYAFASQNDIRQPLFGVFAFPFALLARVFSAILFMIPNSYAVVLQVIQIELLAVTGILLARLLKLERNESIAFWVLGTCTYSYMLYSLVVEQYVIAYFYVILTIYMADKCKKINYAYFGAVSTLLTSGVLFPLVTRARTCREWIKDMWKAFLLYMSVVTVWGQLPRFLNIRDELQSMTMFTGENVSWQEKTAQFMNFTKSMFWAPRALEEGEYYHMAPAENISVTGIVILALVLLGFFLNREQYIAKISVCWVLFSVVVLYLVGWGTAENGLILYALYFAWAYIVLLYLLLKKLIGNIYLRMGCVIAFAVISFGININEIIHIVDWGKVFYPA
jgi:hypothetical protein